nr:ORF2 [Rodent Torque teno virus 2]
MNPSLLAFKQQEALFRQAVRAQHRLFCDCGDPVQHLLGWRTSTGGPFVTLAGTTTGDDTGEGGSMELGGEHTAEG